MKRYIRGMNDYVGNINLGYDRSKLGLKAVLKNL